jgi:hypothetical protein
MSYRELHSQGSGKKRTVEARTASECERGIPIELSPLVEMALLLSSEIANQIVTGKNNNSFGRKTSMFLKKSPVEFAGSRYPNYKIGN